MQAQEVVDLGHDLRKGILPQGGVNGRADGEDEIPQGLGGEIPPQVDGDGQGHRLLPPAALLPLVVQDGLEQHRRQVLGDGGPVGLGHLLEPVHREKTHGHVQGVKGLRPAGVGVGRPLPAAPEDLPPGVAGVGVLHLLRVRRGIHVQHAAAAGDVFPQLPEVDRKQRAEEGQGPRPVAQGVEYLKGDALLIVEKPHQPAVVLPKAHRLAGVGHVGADKGARGVVGLEIVPEQALLDAHPEPGEAGHGPVHRPLEGRRVHLPVHHR